MKKIKTLIKIVLIFFVCNYILFYVDTNKDIFVIQSENKKYITEIKSTNTSIINLDISDDYLQASSNYWNIRFTKLENEYLLNEALSEIANVVKTYNNIPFKFHLTSVDKYTIPSVVAFTNLYNGDIYLIYNENKLIRWGFADTIHHEILHMLIHTNRVNIAYDEWVKEFDYSGSEEEYEEDVCNSWAKYITGYDKTEKGSYVYNKLKKQNILKKAD